MPGARQAGQRLQWVFGSIIMIVKLILVVSGVTGKNKGKRFWVCSLYVPSEYMPTAAYEIRPVGPGYDSGRKNRAREDVNPAYKCDL